MEVFIKTARSFYGIGIAGLGIQQFIYADFRPVIFPLAPLWIHTSIAAYIVGAALFAGGCCILFGKRARVVSLLLGGFLLLFFVAFQVPYELFLSPYKASHMGVWVDPLKELALSGGAFVMAGLSPDGSNAWKKNYFIRIVESLIPLGRIFFSITMIEFGYGHLLYTESVSTLVPVWIPGHIFWTYFAAGALIGSGVAIILKIKIELVSLLLSIMLFLWVILLHIPRAIADPYTANGNEITSVFEALAFSGIALGISCMHRNNNNKINITLFKPSLQYEKDKQH